MDPHLATAGCGLNLIGALILLVADAWFSRSVLVYLDALENNLNKAIDVLQKGGSEFASNAIDQRRDRGQNRARFTKLLGWGFLTAGFVVQLVSLARGSS